MSLRGIGLCERKSVELISVPLKTVLDLLEGKLLSCRLWDISQSSITVWEACVQNLQTIVLWVSDERTGE